MPPRSGWGKRPAPQSGGRRSLGSAPLSRRPGRGATGGGKRLAFAMLCCLPAPRSTKAERGFARLLAVYAGFSPDLAHSIPLATPSDRCEVPYGLQDTGGNLLRVLRMPLARSSLKAPFVRSPTTIPGLSARSSFSPWLTGARGARRRRNWSARSGRATANRS